MVVGHMAGPSFTCVRLVMALAWHRFGADPCVDFHRAELEGFPAEIVSIARNVLDEPKTPKRSDLILPLRQSGLDATVVERPPETMCARHKRLGIVRINRNDFDPECTS